MAGDPKVYVNGVDARSGQYLLKPRTSRQMAAYVLGEPDTLWGKFLAWLKELRTGVTYGWAPEVNLTEPAQAGWGIVFHKDESQAVRDALKPLIAHRRGRAANEQLVQEMNYQPGEMMREWLARYHMAPGSQSPETVPYYLLLVGSPEKIPFAFGHQLDVEYAVGRLDFDRPEEYAAYAAAVIAAETAAQPPRARETVFFGTRHLFDKATQLSADQLVTPLVNGLPGEQAVCAEYGFDARLILGEAAKRSALCDVLAPPAGTLPPALLFTATHGMGLKQNEPDQAEVNGALLCQDWPGFGDIHPGCYLTAADVPPTARVGGLVAFFFACYGAGTPDFDRYVHKKGSPPPRIAKKPFIAALPKKLLAHPNGGALAVIGHVERAWSYSIETQGVGAQIGPFRNTVARLLKGEPAGHAVKDFNERYATLSVTLSETLEKRDFGGTVDEEQMVRDWIERNDSAGYLLLGDPAVRLCA